MTAKSTSPRDYLGRFGLQEFRTGQLDVIEAILDGADCLCIMPTGGGKSLCYQLPSVMRDGVTIVVSPLIALMKDQVDSLTHHGIAASFVNSTLSPPELDQRLDQMAAGAFDLIYVAPERFRSPRFLEAVRKVRVQLLAVDEAHCISEWGHDFRHDYTRLGQFRQRIGNPQTIALTATATSDVRDDVVKQLGLKNHRTFIAGFARSNLFYSVQACQTQKEKREQLREFLGQTPGSGIIYAATRKGCEEVAEFITGTVRRRVVVYHAGMLLDDRRHVQESFMSGKAEIVVATNAFGMGIDKPDVRFVIHYNLPGSLEAYYQEAGRAGRDSLPSQCLLLYSPSDRYIQEFFIENSYPSPETIEQVYEFLRTHEDDPIELTQEDLKKELGLSIGAEGVGTCERMLEKCGVLERLEPNRNMAAVRIESDVPTIVDLLPKQATTQRSVARALENIVGNRRFELVYFRPAQLADTLGTSTSVLARALRDLTKLEAIDYIPPFRGRAVRMLRRDLDFDQLNLDFAELEARRQCSFQKLDRVIHFATTSACRQREILIYFGEKTSPTCVNCDNCRRRGTVGDMVPALQEAIVKTLSGAARARARFGKQIIAQMLCGSQSAKVLKFKLNELSTFGILSELTQSEVAMLIDSMMEAGLLEQVEIEKFRPIVRNTELGGQVMRGQAPPPKLVLPQTLEDRIKAMKPSSGPEPHTPPAAGTKAAPAESAPVQVTAPPPATPVPGKTYSPSTPPALSVPAQVLERVPSEVNAKVRPDRGESVRATRVDSAASQVAPAIPKKSAAIVPGAIQPDHYWTWRLLRDGYSAEDCRLIRRMDVETQMDHVLRAMDDGQPVAIGWLLTTEQISLLQQTIGASAPSSIRSVLDRLPPTYNYQQVMLYLKCRDQAAKVAPQT
jgi:ATP-dependent DNA helicase RecQ